MNNDSNRLARILQIDETPAHRQLPEGRPAPGAQLDARDRSIAEAAAIHQYLMTQRCLLRVA
jgi:hypothetical protein